MALPPSPAMPKTVVTFKDGKTEEFNYVGGTALTGPFLVLLNEQKQPEPIAMFVADSVQSVKIPENDTDQENPDSESPGLYLPAHLAQR